MKTLSESARLKRNAAQRQWYSANRDKAQASERRYDGLPDPLYPPPLACECCGRPPGKLSLALDHCHVTGEFRGWLCTSCNTAIGKLGDNLEGLYRAIAYLKRAAMLEVAYEHVPNLKYAHKRRKP